MSTITSVRSASEWKTTFDSWSSPPSETEEAKCENAVRAIRIAVDANDSLSRRDIDVVPQGSYQNNTNARLQSDVDVCVRLNDAFFYDLPAGVTAADLNIVPATYTYSQFKSDVEKALTDHFGKAAVTRGNKAFDIHENAYRIDADVVAAFRYRRYDRTGGELVLHEGTSFESDKAGGRVVNWPEQNYDNGVAKNTRTSRRFKKIVRVLKRLRNEMADDKKVVAAIGTTSFLVECLTWNVPDEGFNRGSYYADVRWALAHLFNNTRTDEACNEWGEVNELKYLLRGGQPWTRQGAHDFVSAAWDYVGFE
jgi:hypothetical protein